MTKQQTAEWMLCNLLEFEDFDETFYMGKGGTVADLLAKRKIIDFIYSPDGKAAIRAKLKERFGYGLRIEHNISTDGRETCYISKHTEGLEFAGNGADEYEAFYQAVKEVMG
jgi:hypothetical protein